MKNSLIQIVIVTCGTIMAFSIGKDCFAGGHENSPTPVQKDDLSDLRQLANADPVKDFDEAKLKNDIHLIGVGGIGLLVPGVNKESEYYKRVEIRLVKGTGDASKSDDMWASNS